jgi:hypothetical protein
VIPYLIPDDAPWADHPGRNCRPPEGWSQTPADVRLWADQWFPSYERSHEQLCAGCPVLTRCLAYALKHRLEGIYGGTTTYQRAQALTRKSRKKAVA